MVENKSWKVSISQYNIVVAKPLVVNMLKYDLFFAYCYETFDCLDILKSYNSVWNIYIIPNKWWQILLYAYRFHTNAESAVLNKCSL